MFLQDCILIDDTTIEFTGKIISTEAISTCMYTSDRITLN